MARKRCETCGGEYEDQAPGGYAYFHSCPPIVSKIRVKRGNKILEIDPPMLPGDEELDRRFVERPDKRDENVKVERDEKGEPRSVAKAEGKGATKIGG